MNPHIILELTKLTHHKLISATLYLRGLFRLLSLAHQYYSLRLI